MIPENIEIDGMNWSVTVSKFVDDGEYGETRTRACEILLNGNACEQMQEVTFWHELIHAMFATRDFKLTSDCTPDELEEQVASFLGPALWAFFKVNADVRWQ